MIIITPQSSHLDIDRLTVSYTSKGEKRTVLNQFSFKMAAGKFLTIVGASGCGKSTLLNTIGGHIKPDNGRIRINNKLVLSASYQVGMVSQGYALFNWLTVEKNIAFGLRYKETTTEDAQRMIDRLLDVTGLREFQKYYPAQLSGGMQQRVALARAIAMEPAVLLLDEPFSALDTDTRAQMRELLLQLWYEHQTTILFVTHDLEEAALLGDQILILKKNSSDIRIIDVPFERPRLHSLRHSASFQQFTHDVLTQH